MGGRNAEAQNQVLDFTPPDDGGTDRSMSHDSGLGSATLADVKNLGTTNGANSDNPTRAGGSTSSETTTSKPDVDCILDLSKPIGLFKDPDGGTSSDARPDGANANSGGDNSKPDSGFDKPDWIANNPQEQWKPDNIRTIDELRPLNRMDPTRSLEENLAMMYKGEFKNIQQYDLPDGARMVTWNSHGETEAMVVNSNNDVYPLRYGRGGNNEHVFSNGARGRFGEGNNSYTYKDAVGQTAVLQLRTPILPPREDRYWKPLPRL